MDGNGETLARSAKRPRIVARALVIFAIVGTLLATTLPAGAWVRGVDVSSWQHPGSTILNCGVPIDWNQVAAAGHRFAYVKATEKTTYNNPCFSQDWNGAGAAGLYRGAYHYARLSDDLSSAEAQARFFVARVGTSTGPIDLPPMLDLEEPMVDRNGVAYYSTDIGIQRYIGGFMIEWVRRFNNEVFRLTGRYPVIYTGNGYINKYIPQGLPADITSNGRLWVADYTCQTQLGSMFCDTFNPLRLPTVVRGWANWTFWQYTSVETVPGIPWRSDVNVFCCSEGALAGMAGNNAGGGPFGYVDSVTGGLGSVSASGWSIDPDSQTPNFLHIYVDGQIVGGADANQSRPDVGAVFGNIFGSNRGFNFTFPAAAGLRNVCVFGINQGPGSNSLIGCRQVNVQNASPIGFIDTATATANSVSMSGWVVDPDSAQSNTLNISIDGVQVSQTVANTSRPDVGAVIPGAGSNRGFSFTVPAQPGRRQVCVTAINAGAGVDSQIGCRTLNVVAPGTNAFAPMGFVDWFGSGFGLVFATGWALDLDTDAPIQIEMDLNGQVRQLTANRFRPDVGAFFGTGADRGFLVILPRVGDGPQRLCLRAIDSASPSTRTELGCFDG